MTANNSRSTSKTSNNIILLGGAKPPKGLRTALISVASVVGVALVIFLIYWFGIRDNSTTDSAASALYTGGDYKIDQVVDENGEDKFEVSEKSGGSGGAYVTIPTKNPTLYAKVGEKFSLKTDITLSSGSVHPVQIALEDNVYKSKHNVCLPYVADRRTSGACYLKDLKNNGEVKVDFTNEDGKVVKDQKQPCDAAVSDSTKDGYCQGILNDDSNGAIEFTPKEEDVGGNGNGKFVYVSSADHTVKGYIEVVK